MMMGRIREERGMGDQSLSSAVFDTTRSEEDGWHEAEILAGTIHHLTKRITESHDRANGRQIRLASKLMPGIASMLEGDLTCLATKDGFLRCVSLFSAVQEIVSIAEFGGGE
uniref:Uncharacterized protein n=1 Tax=Tetraselmis sp. GSL018 TaxID=582737 RepID=A0A061QH52_9CHLO